MQSSFDVLIVGGGIIGAAAGHHLASAGYRALLVEKGDYASGTSSRTSRMHNCGFMYFVEATDSPLKFMANPRKALRSLELARRTMRERADFVASSPDRVIKREFFIPFETRSGITAFKMRAGAWLLQLMGGRRLSLEPRYLTSAQARRHPLLSLLPDADKLNGAFSFAEYQYNWPERIVVDTIIKGREAGLDARNYTKLVALTHDRQVWRATLEGGGVLYQITAKAVVNAAGAWVDHVTRLATDHPPQLNTGAKGVNMLIRLPPKARGLGLETVTPRGTPYYIMPWGDLHYAGSVDSAADAEATEFRATDAELAQLLADTNALFPTLDLGPEDILHSWAGVRPRTAEKGQALGSMDVREHDLSDRGLPAFIAFSGGLIMTHRDAGRRLLAAVRKHLQPSGHPRAIDYRLAAQSDEDAVTRQSVMRAIVHEQAQTLGDILRRRLSVGWHPDLGLGVAEKASRFAAPLLGWSEETRREQVQSYQTQVHRSFRPSAALVMPPKFCADRLNT